MIFSEKNSLDDYIIGKQIGQGAYAVVRIGLYKPSNKKVKAAAVLTLTTHQGSESAIERAVRSLKRSSPVLSKPFLLRIAHFND